jgi:hypothetical protein
VRRFFVILLGYYAAAVGATETTIVTKVIRDVLNETGETLAGGLGASIILSPIAAIVVAVLASVPAAIVIVLGEAMEVRRWYYYSASGGFTGLIVSLSGSGSRIPRLPSRFPSILDNFTFILFVSGCVGGLVYWATAGRNAGRSAG